MRDFEHLLRVAGVAVLGVGGFLGVRSLLIPDSYGKIGHYRATAIDDVKAHATKYAGRSSAETCAGCHEEVFQRKAKGSHRGIWCETCHGPAGAHMENPGEVKPLRPAEGEARAFCARCHEDNHSRPKGFPAVNLAAHHPKISCLKCHASHSPKVKS